MANVLFARNIIDANVNDAAAVLPAVNSTTYSDEWDLGPATHEDGYEISCDLPLLTTTHLVNALTTLKVSLISSDTASDQANGTQIPGTELTVTGTGANIAAASYRWKVPSTASRYVSVRFVLLGAGSNAATANATNVGLRF
jgi:hypothetical protein